MTHFVYTCIILSAIERDRSPHLAIVWVSLAIWALIFEAIL